MKNKLIIFILLLTGFLGCYRLMRPGYFSMQDDMHVFRLQQYDQCLQDSQIPCRRITEGGFGYGYPLYNFYSPLSYTLGEVFHLIGFSYIDSIKLVFITTSFIRPIGIFLLSSLFFGPGGGLVSAIIFSFAPYQALNSYVRGAIAENLALALVPFVFWAIKTNKKITTALFVALLSLSHNLTLLYTLPLIIIFTLYTKSKLSLWLHIFLGFGLAAFFLIPAFMEKNYTNVFTMTQDYFDYHLHYTTLSQLFVSRFWGFGGSTWGDRDGMSFQVGYFQWIIPLVVLGYFLISQKIKKNLLIFFIFFVGLFALFLTHNKSTFIWETVPLLAYYQFPWRLIALAIFCFSLISGAIVKFTKPWLVIIALLISIVLNFSYFKEDLWFSSLTDAQKLSPANIVNQSGAGLRDYWPKFGTKFPNEYASGPIIASGSAQINSFNKNSLGVSGQINVSESALITFPIVYFPNFELLIDQKPAAFTIDNNLGLINVYFNPGTHVFSLKFTNTPIRIISNIISLVSIVILFYLYRRHHD